MPRPHLKALSSDNARVRFLQGKIDRFNYALYRYLHDVTAVKIFSPEDLVSLRHELGLTQEALGDILHVTKRTVQRWENDGEPITGTVNIALNALQKLEGGFFDLMKPECPRSKLVSRESDPVSLHRQPTAERPQPPIPTDFNAQAVIDLRERLGMSRREFARFFSVSTSTIDKWETGAGAPKGPALTLLKIIWRNGAKVMPTP